VALQTTSAAERLEFASDFIEGDHVETGNGAVPRVEASSD